APTPTAPLEALTPRELEVLRLMAGGCTNAEIAARLGISLGTVKAHTHHIYGKLDVRSRTEAVMQARNRHLI
ncbi:LuxR family transcriptional regulator, partial [Litorilinea aerophila]